MDQPKNGDLRVWHIPQVPGPMFTVDVNSLEEGVKLVDTLCDYDQFQYKNKIKPDYANASGIERYEDDEDWFEVDLEWEMENGQV